MHNEVLVEPVQCISNVKEAMYDDVFLFEIRPQRWSHVDLSYYYVDINTSF